MSDTRDKKMPDAKREEAAEKKKRAKQKKPRHSSMRGELSLMVIGIIALALVLICAASALLLTPFYQDHKEKRLLATYDKLDDLSEDDELTDEILQSTVQDNIRVTVVNADFQKILADSDDVDRDTARLFGYYTGFYNEEVKVLKRTDNYTIQETQDRRISTSYLEMWGQLSNGNWFLLQTPIESFETASRITTGFFIIVGLFVIAISVAIVWFTMKRYTEPIMQLNELSKRMANLDFDAHYTGTSHNEIGDLGHSFNKMADELEHAIGDLKSANVELKKDNERKTRIDEVRKEFLNNVSHELKTPIALIQGYAEGLKDNVADDAESREFYTDVIIDEAGKMNTMVQKLLTLNKLEFGQDKIAMERFDLTQLIRGVISSMQVMIDEAGAKVSFPVNESVYVWGDEFKIEEVVTNYLSNACHHVDGEKKIEVTIHREDGDIVRTSVFNTGQPIPEDSIGRVFEKFYKVDKARTRAYGGSGIGLSIVKAIMDGHNQKCGVKNYENGVSFWFTMDGSARGGKTAERTEGES